MWRLLTDPRIKATMRELEEDWTIDDVMDAHDVLDFRDWMELQETKRVPRAKGKR